MTTQTKARREFDALFNQKLPTREEWFMRDDFRVLASMVGMSYGECYDALVKKASATKYGGNTVLAAEDWFAQVSAPRF